MQPPTRTARRNGSGIASGRRRGGTDGASARKADGGGRKGARPNKNPARRTRTRLHGTGRQRCHLGFGCHRRRECGQHFCRGSESCVHRFDCPGGGPFCAACCRAGFSHSRLQETSAGRNLITLFHTVNNRAYFFSRPPVPTAAPSVARSFVEYARAHPIDSRQASFDIAETQAWRGFRRCDVFSRGVFSITRAVARGGRRRSSKANPEEKIPLRDGRRFRVAQAELRETARTVFGLERRSTTASTERGARRRDDALGRTTATDDVAEHVCLRLGDADERQRRHARRRPFVCRGRRTRASTRRERGELESVFRSRRRPSSPPRPALVDAASKIRDTRKTTCFPHYGAKRAARERVRRPASRSASEKCRAGHGALVCDAARRVDASAARVPRRRAGGERSTRSSRRLHASRSGRRVERAVVVGFAIALPAPANRRRLAARRRRCAANATGIGPHRRSPTRHRIDRSSARSRPRQRRRSRTRAPLPPHPKRKPERNTGVRVRSPVLLSPRRPHSPPRRSRNQSALRQPPRPERKRERSTGRRDRDPGRRSPLPASAALAAAPKPESRTGSAATPPTTEAGTECRRPRPRSGTALPRPASARLAAAAKPGSRTRAAPPHRPNENGERRTGSRVRGPVLRSPLPPPSGRRCRIGRDQWSSSSSSSA